MKILETPTIFTQAINAVPGKNAFSAGGVNALYKHYTGLNKHLALIGDAVDLNALEVAQTWVEYPDLTTAGRKLGLCRDDIADNHYLIEFNTGVLVSTNH